MRWTPTDIIAMVIAAVVSLILLISVLKPFITERALPTPVAELISNLTMALIAIVSMYIGSKLNKK